MYFTNSEKPSAAHTGYGHAMNLESVKTTLSATWTTLSAAVAAFIKEPIETAFDFGWKLTQIIVAFWVLAFFLSIARGCVMHYVPSLIQ